MLQIFLQAGNESSPISLGIMIAVFVVFYIFFILLPQRKREKEKKNFFNVIKPGDHVVTVGGMHGKIISIEDDIVLLEFDRNMRVKVDKTALDTSRLNAHKAKTIEKSDKAEKVEKAEKDA
jgi:preprotein translocase subunit YajC